MSAARAGGKDRLAARRTTPVLPLIVFALLVIAIGGTGAVALRHYKAAAKLERQIGLSAITDLKAKQIESWLGERHQDARIIGNDPFLGDAIGSWMRAGRPDDSRRAVLLARLRAAQEAYAYGTIFLLDADGRIVLATQEAAHPPCEAARKLAVTAVTDHASHWTDVHAADGTQAVEMEFVVPLAVSGTPAERAAGALVFRDDPREFLFPLIQSWPVHSDSAESFLFRGEGEWIVYLNTLRHRSDPPLSLRFSAREASLLAALAVRGREGILEGQDYRRIAVVGAARKISGAPWYLVSKVDTAEIYAPIERGARIISSLILGFIALSGLATFFWWHQYRARERLREVRAALEREALAKHYDYLTRYANDVILLCDADGGMVDINDRGSSFYGYSREELLHMNVRQLHAGGGGEFFDGRGRAAGDGGTVYESVHRRRDGQDLQVEVSVRIVEVDGKCFRQAVIRDTTQRREAEKYMRLYASVFATTSEAVLVTDLELRIVAVNPAFTEITGYQRDEVLGRTPRMFRSGRQDDAFYAAMWASILQTGRWQGEIWNRHKDGHIYPQWQSTSVVRDGEGRPTHYVAIFADISERKSAEERINYLALHDALTGMPNRTLMEDRLGQALGAAQRAGTSVAVLLIDLDGFKAINDAFGHPVGDQLLQQVASRLRDCVRQVDTVSRLGGDEFVVILPEVQKAEDAAHVAEKIVRALAPGFEVRGQAVRTTGSIGISLYPHDATTIEALIRDADTAMYRAKEGGRNRYRFFSPEMKGDDAALPR